MIVATDDIGGGHHLTLDINSILEQLQRVIKAVKFWCGDNEILNNATPQVFLLNCQACQRKGEWALKLNKKVVHRDSNVS